MHIYLTALAVLAAGALAEGILALMPVTVRTNKAANAVGVFAASAACVLGFWSVFHCSWAAPQAFAVRWGLPFGAFSVGMDALSRLFLLPVFGLGLTCALSGGISLSHVKPEEHDLGGHWCFYLLLLLGMVCVLTARDALFFMLSWEIMSLAPFFLIDFNDRDRQVQNASWIYLVAAHLGAVLLIAFFALLWSESGSTAFADMAGKPAAKTVPLFLLAFFGFGAKIGFAPLHVWLPEAHPAAPSHVSALLSGAMLNAGLYGIIRSFDFLGPAGSLPAWLGWIPVCIGILTALMAILKALGQSNLKRLLAYSSVENMGIMLMGFGIGTIGAASSDPWAASLGFAGCLFHMLNHSAFKGLLFLCSGEVLHAVGTVNMAMLGGLQKKMPLLGALFALGAASIACLPPLNGFAGDFVLAMPLVSGAGTGGLEHRFALLLCLAALMLVSGIAAAVYAKAYGMAFLGSARSAFAETPHCPESRLLFPLLFPAAFCVFAGFGAKWVFAGIWETVASVPLMTADLYARSAAAAAETQSILGRISVLCLSGLALAILLMVLRRTLLARNGRKHGPVWGCGFQYGTARIQYSPASFAEPAAKIFAPIMGTSVREHADDAYFPKHAALSVHAPDAIRTKLYEPVFDYVQRCCNALKILQNGMVNWYIFYILVILVGLLVWGIA